MPQAHVPASSIQTAQDGLLHTGRRVPALTVGVFTVLFRSLGCTSFAFSSGFKRVVGFQGAYELTRHREFVFESIRKCPRALEPIRKSLDSHEDEAPLVRHPRNRRPFWSSFVVRVSRVLTVARMKEACGVRHPRNCRYFRTLDVA